MTNDQAEAERVLEMQQLQANYDAMRAEQPCDGDPYRDYAVVRWFIRAFLVLAVVGSLAGCGTTELATCRGDVFALNPSRTMPVAAVQGARL